MSNIFIIIKHEDIPFSEASLFTAKGKNGWIAILDTISDALYNHFGIQVRESVTLHYNSNKEFYIHAPIYLEHFSQAVYFPEQKVIGPKIDAQQKAIEGFYHKWESKGGKITKEKNNYAFIKKSHTKTAKEIAPEIVEQILLAISQEWKETLDIAPLPWSRPIISISAFLNEEEIKHKFSWHHCNDDIAVLLQEHCPTYYNDGHIPVIFHFKTYGTTTKIEEKVAEIEERDSITCVSRQSIKELAWLYEDPQFQEAEIPQEYLSLPKAILNLTIATNQRYILFERYGNIVPQFLIVGKKHSNTILQGHLQTLKARLDDAQYYINKDLKTFEITQISKCLHKITFHHKYGSIFKRVESMQKLAREIFPEDDKLQQAIALCKNDLNTNTVQSFTDLQGYCGGYYLEKLGANKEIAQAVSEHYKPINPKDSIPETLTGLRLSFVGKLQKVNALAEVGEIPTSSRDPFAIRRDILSIIRICTYEKIDININIFAKQLHSFVQERAKLFLKNHTTLSDEEAQVPLKRFQLSGNFVDLSLL
ncbi:MAG: glycyl-tRNA synthetase beta chain [Candidatus Deianiraeaceae bacterium]|jgi:glycyl-tRNA synthetase beta chain